MREIKDIKINKVPSPTWRWLSLNDYFLSNVEVPAGISSETELPLAVEVKEIPEFSAGDIKSGMGDDFNKLMKCSNAPVHLFKKTKSGAADSPVSIKLMFNDSCSEAYQAEFELVDDSSLTVVMDLETEEGASGLGAVSVRYKLGQNAKLNLIQLVHCEGDYTILDDIGGECADKANFSLIQIVIGSGKVFLGASSALEGKRSRLDTKLAYLVDGGGYLDVNYIADHLGKKTESEIGVAGVLRDSAKKVFRGTIDFKKGCAGAVGSEIEDVILMNEGVINQTIPVILCAEEDVEGSHGATIGKLPSDMLFYMTSRGMELDNIYELMARARITAVSQSIPVPEFRDKIEEILDEKAADRKEREL
ncbi:MAG: SufD family Fe-S cluster assembly protein [Lachnospiraceae bacterium]|nr:SufD family Fe-S cluster assembly protein [Lachnospiraceae bacterium]